MNPIFPWLTHAWQQLTHYRFNHRIPAGIVINGPSGIGKLALAKEYSHLILCKAPRDHRACGSCRSCILFKASTHPDFFLIQSEEKSQTIKVEQIRTLVEMLAQTSVLEGYQVVIIALAEEMNKAAANALLKTLEEPQGQVLMLLLTSQPTAVLPTILSRCQQLKIAPPSRMEVEPWLSAQLSSPHMAMDCLMLAHNLPLKALEYAKTEKQTLPGTLMRYLQQIQDGTIDPTVAAADCLTSTLDKLQFLATLTMDMIRIKFAIKELLTHPDKGAALSALCRSLTIRQLFKFLDDILEAIQLLINSSNANVQLLMEKIFINWRYYHDIS